jgi:hypothetical protein
MTKPIVLCHYCRGPILCMDDAWVQWRIYKHEELYELNLVHHMAASNSRRCTYGERGKNMVEIEDHHGEVFIGFRSEFREYLRSLCNPMFRLQFNKIMRNLRTLAARDRPKPLPTDKAFKLWRWLTPKPSAPS